MAPAHSLAFSLDGGTLYCGFNRAVRAFRVERPGRWVDVGWVDEGPDSCWDNLADVSGVGERLASCWDCVADVGWGG